MKLRRLKIIEDWILPKIILESLYLAHVENIKESFSEFIFQESMKNFFFMFVVGMNISIILDSRERKMTKHMQKQKKNYGFLCNSDAHGIN